MHTCHIIFAILICMYFIWTTQKSYKQQWPFKFKRMTVKYCIMWCVRYRCTCTRWIHSGCNWKFDNYIHLVRTKKISSHHIQPNETLKEIFVNARVSNGLRSTMLCVKFHSMDISNWRVGPGTNERLMKPREPHTYVTCQSKHALVRYI